MEGAGPALMGIGIAEGDDRAKEAAKKAVNSPLLDVSGLLPLPPRAPE